ncbi:hypothetical protein D7V80_11650 [Corallococcus sp. CA054B]|uniref:phage tail assembly chaperone n=1 Tax=Corallococcus sp. CA054B TaxID=2316734 RepID=UPI000EA2794C|nr:hypothetical protein [Corallococcus sp. CA054B]RKG68646.1 hypothetical protein D7V80_11650 [Corallococcus sp. CA054B]
MERATGKPPPELLEAPPLPEALAHVWGWFAELSNARGAGAFTLNPISFSDMESWVRLSGHRPTSSEVQLLRRLDEAFLVEVSKK